MLQYDLSPYAGAIPSWPNPNPMTTQFGGYQAAPPGASRLAPTPGYSPLGVTENPLGAYGQSEYNNPFMQPTQQHLSPERFAGGLGRQQFNLPLMSVDTIFVTELARCARGLQEVSEQFESKDSDTQRRAFYAATAHLFYALGLLSSKGIFITGDLPMGRVRPETISVANACREFGKQLERFLDKYASGRNVIEELTGLVERGKLCFTEITKGIEGSEVSITDQQARKKVA